MDLKILQNKINYQFRNDDLLVEAMSHPSLNHNRRKKEGLLPNYERLELLGDSVLSLIIVEYLFHKFRDQNEGSLAKMRSNLVCKESIAKAGESVGISNFIIMTEGEENTGGRDNINNIENATESLLGAIYIDSGSLDIPKKTIHQLWGSMLENPEINDPKSSLQEWAQSSGKGIPNYIVTKQEGSIHEPFFTVKVTIKGYSAKGSGSSKKNAEKDAAQQLLSTLKN